MRYAALRSNATWAENRAPVRTDPSADPGAKTEARAASFTGVARSSPLRDWRQCDQRSRHEAAKSPAGRASSLANARRLQFQFTANQDRAAASRIDLNFEHQLAEIDFTWRT